MTMLKPLILTGLTPKSPFLALHMLIWHHETLYGNKKEQVSTHEQAWASMSKNAKSADFNGFNFKIPYFGPPHAHLNFDNMRPSLVTIKSKWSHMSKHEQAWARMLIPLILTGLTQKSPILALHMLIKHHETLYGDKKEQLSTHEQAWGRMLNPLILTGLTSESPILFFHILIWHHETLYGYKRE